MFMRITYFLESTYKYFPIKKKQQNFNKTTLIIKFNYSFSFALSLFYDWVWLSSQNITHYINWNNCSLQDFVAFSVRLWLTIGIVCCVTGQHSKWCPLTVGTVSPITFNIWTITITDSQIAPCQTCLVAFLELTHDHLIMCLEAFNQNTCDQIRKGIFPTPKQNLQWAPLNCAIY